MWSTDVPVHLIVTYSIFLPKLFLERAACQLNVLAELIYCVVCLFSLHNIQDISPSLIKTMNRYVQVRWFQHSPTCSDPLLPPWLCRLRGIFVCKFSVLWCSIWYVNYISFYWASSMHMAERCIYEHRPMGLSLSHTHTHAQVGPIELFLCSWQLLIRFHCNLTFFLTY